MGSSVERRISGARSQDSWLVCPDADSESERVRDPVDHSDASVGFLDAVRARFDPLRVPGLPAERSRDTVVDVVTEIVVP